MTGVSFLVIFIVATVYFMRSKHHDDLDKKSAHHLPLPMDYASNEGNCIQLFTTCSGICKQALKNIFRVCFFKCIQGFLGGICDFIIEPDERHSRPSPILSYPAHSFEKR